MRASPVTALLLPGFVLSPISDMFGVTSSFVTRPAWPSNTYVCPLTHTAGAALLVVAPVASGDPVGCRVVLVLLSVHNL